MSDAARRLIPLAVLLAVVLGSVGLAQAIQRPSRHHQVYFANTADELNVYRVYGVNHGKTLMIIGGIQGDEPGGFLTADLYADLTLAKGNLIVVPRANLYSIIMKQRGPDGDMNRQFGDPVTAQRHKKIVKILKELIAQSDLLLNLHEGSGFYRPRWESSQANPKRYGQCIIADSASFPMPGGGQLNLQEIAQRVLARVNPAIDNPGHRLLFNNHRTAAADSIHKEQRRSATYYALTHCHIPAFGVETSKSLANQSLKIHYHKLVINAFLQEMGIQVESPGLYLARPEFKFLVVSVNDHQPVVVNQGGTLTLRPGDRVKVLHLEANYDRGLTCDFLNLGSINDTRRPLVVTRPTKLVVRKDHDKIGEVAVELAQGERSYTTVRSPILYFLVDVAGQRRVVADNEQMSLVRGDKLTLVDLISNLPQQRGIKVNFKGFVPSGRGGNLGEDRGYEIDTAQDLMARYSHCPQPSPGKGVECYQVLARQGERQVGGIQVLVHPARLEYLILKRTSGHKEVYHNGETVPATMNESLEVVDLRSNVHPAQELDLVLDGKGRRLRLAGRRIDLGSEASRRLVSGKGGDRHLRLLVLRQDQAIGHVRLDIGGH